MPNRTDIIGFPIWNNFNVFRYIHIYNAITLVFPLAALGVYLAPALVRRLRRGKGAGRSADPAPLPAVDELPQSPSPGVFARIGRSALVGSALGLTIAHGTDEALGGFLFSVLAIASGYLGLLAGLAGFLPGEERFWQRYATVNAFAAALSLSALYLVSRATHMSVLSDATTDPFPWLPPQLAMVMAAAALLWVGVRIRRSRGELGAIWRVEGDALMFLVGPALVFLLISTLPNALGWMDIFHEGEWLAGSRLVDAGRFPWRDLYFVHGPLYDVFYARPGLEVFEQSRWGAAAGFSVLVQPAMAVAFIVVGARLFRGDWIAIAALTAVVIPFRLDARFVLLPVALFLLLGLLRRPSPLRALILGVFLFAQSVLTAETAPFAVAVGLVLVSFEVYHRDASRNLVASLANTYWFVAGASAAAVVWAGYLALHGALDDFLLYGLTFARGHELTGGIPVQWQAGLFLFAVIAPVAALFAFAGYFLIQLRRRRLLVEDWALVALFLYVLFYYRKFLSRADNHIFQVLAVSMPLIAYLIHRAVTAIEQGVRRARIPRALQPLASFRPISLALLVAALIWPPNSVLATVKTLPSHFAATTPTRPWLPSLGYATGESLDRAAFEDVRTALRELPNPTGEIFDFTNQPGLFHYLLGYPPATRYYHVSLAIRRSTQDDLLTELRADPPGIVVFHGQAGLPGWDGVPNAVRHHEISDYLLDHYRPVIVAGGNLIMLRNDLDPPAGWPAGLDLNYPPAAYSPYFFTLPCNWGYAQSFLEGEPPSEVGSLDLTFAETRVGRRGIELELPPGFQSYDWLEIRSATAFRNDAFTLRDRLGLPAGTIVFKTPEGAGPGYLVRVGSCLQWRGYRQGPLFLLHSRPQDIVAVRLLRSEEETGSP